jgi:hypothetical protein
MKERIKVFLGGTCNGSTWREDFIKLLKDEGLEIDCFNPVVDVWTTECQKKEEIEKDKADWILYVITPDQKGIYSIAEVVDDSNKRPDKVIFAILRPSIPDTPYFCFPIIPSPSLHAVISMLGKNGVKTYLDLKTLVDSFKP